MRYPRWTTSAYGRGIEDAVPAVSGVYAVGRITRVHGLVNDVVWLYVGQSRNLRRRYTQHTQRYEPNRVLEAIRNDYDHEFWWTAVALDRLDEVERDLIAELQPEGNQRHRRRPA